MRRFLLFLTIGLAGAAALSGVFAATSGAASLFSEARTQIGSKPPVPVYLPSRLPRELTRHGIKLVVGQRIPGGYTVSLYYSEQPSNASFAGMISGSNATYQALPNTQVVLLGNGAKALFRPVSCGGSCAPANLWWHTGGSEYQIQLKLSSQLPRNKQLSALLVAADSMVLYQ